MEAITANPGKSCRMIAEEIGVHYTTIARARQRTGASVSAQIRIGKHGKKRKQGRGSGYRLRLNGHATLSDAVRAGLEIERGGGSRQDAVAKAGIGWCSYINARDIVLLSERDDLSAKASATVKQALNEMDETRRIKNPTMLVRPIVESVWGVKGNRFKTDKKRLEDFLSSVSIVHTTCLAVDEIRNFPPLDEERRRAVSENLKEAILALRQFCLRFIQGE